MTDRIINLSLLAGLAATAMQLHGVDQKLARIEDNQNKTDSSAAAAVTKFEKDFFAKLASDEARRQAALNFQQAQRNAAINQGLRGLPTGQMDHPQTWNRE
jgi:hypothetical protein